MSSETQEAVILVGVGNIEFGERPIPTCGPHSVKVKIEATGICGSDVHYFMHGSIGSFQLKAPMVLGHESSGTVVEVGENVTMVKVGDRVAIEPGVPSRYSSETKAGKYNLCPHMAFAATPPYDGTLVKYYLSPEDFLYKLPESVSFEEGALLEPLSVGVHANKLAGTKFGDTVVVFGAGPVGLLSAGVAKAFGATTVLVVDIIDFKLNKAKELGATHVLNSGSFQDPGALGTKIRGLVGANPDITIDCTGSYMCINAAIQVCRPGGTHVQVGLGEDNVTIPIVEVTNKELKISGSFRYSAGDYSTALKLIASKQIDAAKLVTRKFKFEEAIEAYKFNAKPNDYNIKTIIEGPK
ncbi:HDL549Wp [Eremothecium sinecaudum]|uniref:HDL549Wp n=1 Tax=Eremothecium sinecaudum TaxID=45286 RepID=A0A0X8HRM5_9SACH|nr:HDL549Wp [Eremothecium sinecaudum]AMD20195.1 HDL549Wp [Eremothecium sinecaudum]